MFGRRSPGILEVMSLEVRTESRGSEWPLPPDSWVPWGVGGDMSGHRVVRQSFLPERRSVRAVGRFVVSALDEWDLLGIAHVALLLTSDMATDALLRARAAFEVALRCEGGRLRVEVVAGDGRRPNLTCVGDGGPTIGRRLRVVQALAHSWGAEDRRDGQLVWFELAVPGDGARLVPSLAASGR